MKKERKAQIATLAVLLATLGVAVISKSGWPLPSPKAGQNAQDTIYAMLDAARAGNVKAYLACYTGPLEAALRQSLRESTESGLAKYLRESNSSIKGIAVADPQTITDTTAKVRVEYVYEDRNEAQMLYLERSRNGWKISRVDSDEHVKTLIPYGTPVK